MTISEIIKELERLKEEHGDISVGADFWPLDKKLAYDVSFNCIVGE